MLIKKEVKEIYYGTGVEAWDTQGPAPSGFHVPTNTEWQAVFDMGVALGQWSSTNGDGMRIKLKLPFAGYRNRSTSNVNSQGSNGYYWSSTAYSADNAYSMYFYSSSLYPQDWNNRAYGFSVRCFRNSPLKPSSNWTVIYEGSDGAGIFHNPSEGVISISSDGQTWITIADKNLGATTVYNDGDALSETNCGKYYQWGNNYGFYWTGTVTTSSTKVNASSYGPGNYYSSSTFIKVSSAPYNRSSVQNDNLRGGVSQGVSQGAKKIKSVYLGTSSGFEKIRPNWKPGSSTYAYYPLKKDVLDYSGNNRNLTNSGITFTGGYGNFNGSSYGYINTSLVKTNNTISFWYRKDRSGGSTAMDVFNNGLNDSSKNSIFGRFGVSSSIYGQVLYAYGTTSQTGQQSRVYYTYSGLFSGNWHHITFIKNGSTLNIYINGEWKASETISGTNSENSYFAIGRGYNGVYPLYGQLSNFIIENKARTATEIQNYYNLTKSDYGL